MASGSRESVLIKLELLESNITEDFEDIDIEVKVKTKSGNEFTTVQNIQNHRGSFELNLSVLIIVVMFVIIEVITFSYGIYGLLYDMCVSDVTAVVA